MSKEFVKERVLKYLMEDLLVPQDMIDTNVPLSEFEEGAEGVLDIIVNVVVKEHGEDYYVPVLIVTCVDEDFVMEGEALQKEIDLKQKELKILEEKVLFWEEDKDKTINEIYDATFFEPNHIISTIINDAIGSDCIITIAGLKNSLSHLQKDARKPIMHAVTNAIIKPAKICTKLPPAAM